jgi:hypothetical protein
MQPAGSLQTVNLNTIKEVMQPRAADEIVKWRPGYAWLAGGTWLFSTPQIATDTLIDLRSESIWKDPSDVEFGSYGIAGS